MANPKPKAEAGVAAPEVSIAAEALDTPPVTSAEPVTANLPSTEVIDYSQYEGLGRQEATTEDYAIPFLRILQKLSDEVDEIKPKFINGAKAGDFLNTVSNQLFSGKTGLRVIPVQFQREFVEWVPREKGGGFRGSYKIGDPIIATAKMNDTDPKKARMLLLPNGNDLIDTCYQYVMVEAPNGDRFPAIIAFTSSQLKKVRKWNSMKAQKRLVLSDGKEISNPPDFAFYYHVSTVVESNTSGSWSGWTVNDIESPTNVVPAKRFKEALEFYKQITSGLVKRAEETAEMHREPGADDDHIPGFESESGQKVF